MIDVMSFSRRVAARLFLAAASLSACAPSAFGDDLVHLRGVDPTILQSMRYATANNFTGAPVAGYLQAAECMLTPGTASAIARSQARLVAQNLTLIVYDCYRPERAVQNFVAWMESAGFEAAPATRRFLPNLRARDLIRLGYLARRSAHSRGVAVDVGLARLGATEASLRTGDLLAAPCTETGDPGALEMGTAYDCLDPRSHAGAAGLTETQRRNRRTLREALLAEGFSPYRREWWHFSYPPDDRGVSFDAPITPYE